MFVDEQNKSLEELKQDLTRVINEQLLDNINVNMIKLLHWYVFVDVMKEHNNDLSLPPKEKKREDDWSDINTFRNKADFE